MELEQSSLCQKALVGKRKYQNFFYDENEQQLEEQERINRKRLHAMVLSNVERFIIGSLEDVIIQYDDDGDEKQEEDYDNDNYQLNQNNSYQDKPIIQQQGYEEMRQETQNIESSQNDCCEIEICKKERNEFLTFSNFYSSQYGENDQNDNEFYEYEDQGDHFHIQFQINEVSKDEGQFIVLGYGDLCNDQDEELLIKQEPKDSSNINQKIKLKCLLYRKNKQLRIRLNKNSPSYTQIMKKTQKIKHFYCQSSQDLIASNNTNHNLNNKEMYSQIQNANFRKRIRKLEKA